MKSSPQQVKVFFSESELFIVSGVICASWRLKGSSKCFHDQAWHSVNNSDPSKLTLYLKGLHKSAQASSIKQCLR